MGALRISLVFSNGFLRNSGILDNASVDGQFMSFRIHAFVSKFDNGYKN